MYTDRMEGYESDGVSGSAGTGPRIARRVHVHDGPADGRLADQVRPDGHPRAEDAEPEAGPADQDDELLGERPEAQRQDLEEADHEAADRLGGDPQQDASVSAAPSRPTIAPSNTNGQRMNASDAPTRRMISISSARATTASRIVFTMMNSTMNADDDEDHRAGGPQDVRHGHDLVGESAAVLDLLDDRLLGPERASRPRRTPRVRRA